MKEISLMGKNMEKEFTTLPKVQDTRVTTIKDNVKDRDQFTMEVAFLLTPEH